MVPQGRQMAKNTRHIAVARQRNRDELRRTSSMQARTHWVTGSVGITGTGELITDLKFPVTFIERPIFTQGAVLDENQPIVTGAFPDITGIVLNWVTKQQSPEQIFYVGCRIGVVAKGSFDQRAFLDYRFEGTAIVNPTFAETLPEDVV